MKTIVDGVRTSARERDLVDELERLSSGSGSHSPSLERMRQALPGIHIDIDACFLSNPLATDLFWTHFNSDVLDDPQLFKRMLEAYPSQNRIIAGRLASTVGVEPSRTHHQTARREAARFLPCRAGHQEYGADRTFSPLPSRICETLRECYQDK